MTEQRHESRTPITVRSVIRWTVRSFVVAVCLLLLTGGIFLASRYSSNRRLMMLAKPTDPNENGPSIRWSPPIFPLREIDADRLSHWIGNDTSTALLHRPVSLFVQGTAEETPDATILSLLRESSGMTQVFILNRELPKGSLEAIATRLRIETLNVELPVISENDASWLSRMKHLKHIEISQSNLDPHENDWSWLKEVPKLKWLTVVSSGASDRDVIALSECPASLSLSLDGPMSDAALARLCDHPALNHLCLGKGAFQLHFPIGSKLPVSLESLSLNWTAVDDDSLALISELPKLKHVYIHGGQVSDEGLRMLAELPMLNELLLEGLPNATDAGMETLASSKSLCKLYVRSLGTTARGLVHLMNIPTWTDIRYDEVEFHRQNAGDAYPRPTLEDAEAYLQLARNRQLEIHQELNMQHLMTPR